jgi:hypothetical protein
VVTWLVEHGATVDLQDNAYVWESDSSPSYVKEGAGNTALSAAVKYGRFAVVKFLIEHGADPSRRVVFIDAYLPAVIIPEGVFGVHGASGGPSHSRSGTVAEMMANSTIPQIKALANR